MKKEAKTLGKPCVTAMKKQGIKPCDLVEHLDSPKIIAAYVSQVVDDGNVREAGCAIATELPLILSTEESKRILTALDAPFLPSAKLKKALARIARN